jgi:hypothetical protein
LLMAMPNFFYLLNFVGSFLHLALLLAGRLWGSCDEDNIRVKH